MKIQIPDVRILGGSYLPLLDSSLPVAAPSRFFNCLAHPVARRLYQFGRRTTLAVALLSSLAAHAQSDFGRRGVASTYSMDVDVQAEVSGTVIQVKVFTLGIEGLDFTAAGGGTCSGLSLAAGQSCKQPVSFRPIAPGLRLGAVVLLDSSSRVLGRSYLVGTGVAALPVFSPGNLTTIVGNGSWNLLNDGLTGPNAEVNLPASIALDAAGNLFIADSRHNRIRRVDARTNIVSTVAGNGSSSYYGDGDLAIKSSLNSPSGITIDGSGDLYIADTGNNVIRQLEASTGIIRTIAGTGASGYSGDRGPAIAATLSEPWGVTVDPAGNLYVADTANHVVRKVDKSGVITTVAGNGFKNPDGSGAFGGDGGPAILASLNRPFAVALDGVGNMYIPDSGNNRVRLVNASGAISTFAGSGSPGFGGDGGPPQAAQLSAPGGVLVDAGQNVYISDTQNNAIRKVNAHTGKILTVAKSQSGRTLDGGVLVPLQLYSPIGIASDGNGNIYIADYFDMRIRELQASYSSMSFTGTPTRVDEFSLPVKRFLENNGNADLTLTAVTPLSHSAIDAASTSCNASAPIFVNRSCSIGVEFAPTIQGNPLVGDIEVSSISTNPILHLKLVGNALPARSTTTTITSTPNPLNYGQAVTFKASVTTGNNTGTLNGTLSFYDGTNLLASGISVDPFGVGTFSTSTLAIGSHTVTAKYGNDSSHGESTSQELSQTVNEPTATSLSASANPVTLGSSVTLQAAVSIVGAANVPLDASVTFFDGIAPLAAVAIDSNGTASISTSNLTPGLHSITALYAGDSLKYILPSTSHTLDLKVLAGTTIQVSSNANPSNYAASVNLTASVLANGANIPVGEVDFFDGATQIGRAFLVGTGDSVALTTSSLSAGTHSITASYAGSDAFASAASAAIIQTVNRAQTVMSIQSDPSPVAGKPFSINASVALNSGTAVPTGSLVFRDGTNQLGTIPLGPTGAGAITVTLNAGTHVIVASYSGDSNDNASESPSTSLNVAPATTSLELMPHTTALEAYSPFEVSATIKGNGSIVPGGNVFVEVDGAAAGELPLVNGVAGFSTSFTTVGVHTVTMTYLGDANDSPAPGSSIAVTVNPVSTVTTLGSTGTGSQVVLFASATADKGPIPTGDVQFSIGAKVIGTVALNGSGAAVFTPNLSAGKYRISATYKGDALHNTSSSPEVEVSTSVPPISDFRIGVNPPTLTLKSSEHTTIHITLTSENGFSDSIGLGCLSLPVNVSCRFEKLKVSLKGGQSQETSLVVDTSAVPGGGATAMKASSAESLLAGFFFPAGLGSSILILILRRRLQSAFLPALALLMLGAATALSGCGSQVTFNSAASGTYRIQVGGISDSTQTAHYQTITLTVTK